MKQEPLVSIVIPVFNREVYINKALESSCSQTYRNIEIIVVDNKSIDDTWKVLQNWTKKDNRIRIFQNHENVGPVLNWKRCLEESRGEYCKILWSDDWMDNTFIEKAIVRMTQDTAFVISWCDVVKNNGEKVLSYVYQERTYKSQYYIKDCLFYKELNFPVSPGCAFFRLNDLREALMITVPNGNGLDSSRNGAGNDLLLYMLTARKYKEIGVIPEVLNYFRCHEDSISESSNIIEYYEWARTYFVSKNSEYREWMNYVLGNAKMRLYLNLKPTLTKFDKLSVSYFTFYVYNNVSSNKILLRKKDDIIKFDAYILYKVIFCVMRNFVYKIIGHQ